MMHKYLVELFSNDENGNPKNRESFQYFDNEINLQSFYEEKHGIYQTVTSEDGTETPTANRKYTIKVSECKYIVNASPATIWERIRG